MHSLTDIRHCFSGRAPRLLTRGPLRHAAVALILRDGERGPEVLFIERAHHDGDPWSGDLGFPGGKVEDRDENARQAAERETYEEIGIDLGRGEFLGRLDDIAGAHLPVAVSCFVYALQGALPLSFSAEVVDAFWVPLQALCDPGRQRLATVHFRGTELQRPAIDLRGAEQTVLWGITYRLTSQFLQILGHAPLPSQADERGSR